MSWFWSPLNSRVDGRDTGTPDHGGLWIASDGALAREESRSGVGEGAAIVQGETYPSGQGAREAWRLAGGERTRVPSSRLGAVLRLGPP